MSGRRSTGGTGLTHRPGVRHGSDPDPWRDVVTETLSVQGGELEFVHPRDAMDLVAQATADARFPPYWAEVWFSGVELAHAVSVAAPQGTVLELGCGLGLPSVAAARAGADVLAVDRSGEALEFARANARRNAVAIGTECCSWDGPARLLERAPWDLVLAADVLYDPDQRRPLLDVLGRLVDEGGEVWIADPGRPPLADFLEAAAADWSIDTMRTRVDVVTISRMRRGPAGET